MATLKIHDGADEFRIEIAGRLAGESVEEIQVSWQNALAVPALRRFTVDISRLSGYDAAGRRLLREMHRHGTQFAAATPLSLVFLGEISTPLRRGPLLLRVAEPNRKHEAASAPQVSAIASGQ